MRHILEIGSLSLDLWNVELDDKPLDDGYISLLREYISGTIRECSYHRQRLQRADVNPDRIRTFEDWERLPLLSPQDVASVGPFTLLPDRYRQAMKQGGFQDLPEEDRIVRVFQTASSTGKPKSTYYTASDWDANTAVLWRMLRQVPSKKIARLFNCFHAGHMAGKQIEEQFSRFGCLVENRHHTYTTTEQVLDQLTSSLAEFGGFTALAVPPGRPAASGSGKGISLDELLQIDANNFIGSRIRLIVIGGAASDKDLRIRERVWEANELAGQERTIFLERYGASETGIAVAECRAGELHTYPGFVYTEVVDPSTGRRVLDGERGMVAFTGLRRGSRFIRYLVGDEATYLASPCSCGRASARLRDIRRVTDLQRLRSGCAAGGI